MTLNEKGKATNESMSYSASLKLSVPIASLEGREDVSQIKSANIDLQISGGLFEKAIMCSSRILRQHLCKEI